MESLRASLHLSSRQNGEAQAPAARRFVYLSLIFEIAADFVGRPASLS
jgi:hypothetical protein